MFGFVIDFFLLFGILVPLLMMQWNKIFDSFFQFRKDIHKFKIRLSSFTVKDYEDTVWA